MKKKGLMELVNKKSIAEKKEYILYILSWLRAGHFAFDRHFEAWLKKRGLTDGEVKEVLELAYSCDEELGSSAVHFGVVYDENLDWLNVDPNKGNKEVEKYADPRYNRHKENKKK